MKCNEIQNTNFKTGKTFDKNSSYLENYIFGEGHWIKKTERRPRFFRNFSTTGPVSTKYFSGEIILISLTINCLAYLIRESINLKQTFLVINHK